MIYEFLYNGKTCSVDLKDNRIASFAESGHEIEVEFTPDKHLIMRNGSLGKEIHAVIEGDKTFVDIDGILFEFVVPSDDTGGQGAGAGIDADPSKVFAPMPGKIVKLMVSEGDEVEIKQHLVIVEAMKMENIVVARAKGKVKAVNFAEGDQVDTDNPIMELEVEE